LDEYREMVEQLGTFPVSKADCYKHESWSTMQSNGSLLFIRTR
jgi:hypothetical protein